MFKAIGAIGRLFGFGPPAAAAAAPQAAAAAQAAEAPRAATSEKKRRRSPSPSPPRNLAAPKAPRRASASGIVLAEARPPVPAEDELGERTTRHLDIDANTNEECIKIVKFLNNLINCFDPAKDAMTSFFLDPAREAGHPYRVEQRRGIDYLVDDRGKYVMGRLGDHHRAFLEELYGDLYNVNRIPPRFNRIALRSFFTGVGDNKDRLRGAVESVFSQPNITQSQYQAFPKLRCLVLGLAPWRVSNMFIAFDTPKTFSDIGDETCRRIVGPFSLIDGAPRDTDDPNQLDLLDHNSRYRDEQDMFQMNKYLDRIDYSKVGDARPYRFTFRTQAGNKDFSFSAAGKSTDEDVVLSTNALRNREIYYQIRDAGAAGISPQDKAKHAFRVFYKEGGDTFIVAWLKTFMGSHSLRPENSVVYTNDLTLLLRAIVNGVKCIYYAPGGQDITLFPILTRGGAAAAPAAAAAATARQRMEPLRDLLLTHNRRILGLLDECIRRSSQDDFSINEFSGIVEPQHVGPQATFRENQQKIQQAIHGACVEMRTYAEGIVTSIEREIEAVNLDTIDEDEFKERYILRYKLVCPFYPGQGNSFTWNKGFSSFLYEDTEEEYATHVFSLGSIHALYAMIYHEHGNSVEVLRNMILNRLDLEEDDEQGGGGKNASLKPIPDIKFSKKEQKDLEEILEHNSHLPNFILYCITTYAPELFYIAYAYAFAMNRASKGYESFFEHSITTKLCAPFGRIEHDGMVEYTPPEKPLPDTNTFCISVCEFLTAVQSLDSYPKELTLFQACTKRAPQVLWFIEQLGKESMKLSSKDPNIHSHAYQYYEDLYTKDLELCIMNKRQTSSPLTGLKRIVVKETKSPVSSRSTIRERISSSPKQRAMILAGGAKRKTRRKLRGKRRTRRR